MSQETLILEYAPTPSTVALVQRLGGRWHGRYAMVRCPAHEDHEPSLSIRQGREAILVHCFAGCEGARVMGALRAAVGGVLPRDAVLARPANDQTAPFRRLWDRSGSIVGTLAERYLREQRGIQFLPPDVRYLDQCPMGKGRAVRFHPALLVGVFRQGRLIAIQRLFLDPQTAIRTGRMMLGASRGGTWPSRHRGPAMFVAEGFESACAYWQITGRAAGTCFGLRNFAGFEIAADARSIVLLPDNDIEGRTAARAAVAERRIAGVSASLFPCPLPYADWAELVRPRPDVAMIG
jgi:hypothetical protein